MADSVLKIANFRCHGNKRMSEPNVTGIVEFADTENHTYNQKLRLHLMIDQSYNKFSGKTPNFSLPWQQLSSEQSLTDVIKLTDPENPLVGARIWGVSPAQAEL